MKREKSAKTTDGMSNNDNNNNFNMKTRCFVCLVPGECELPCPSIYDMGQSPEYSGKPACFSMVQRK